MQAKQCNPTVTYKRSKATRNNLLNYNEEIHQVYPDEEVEFSLNTDQHDSTSSNLCDPCQNALLHGILE